MAQGLSDGNEKNTVSSRPVVGFMCGVDWQHELGEAPGGNPVYASLEDLKQHRPCWEACGVVKVSVELLEWVVPQDILKNSKKVWPEGTES